MASERKFVIENIRRALLKEYIRHETERAGFGGLDIQRTPMGTRIILTAERPGMIIGRKGGTIKELTENIESRFKFDNPRIEVQEDPEPALNPHIMAQKLASALERGWHFRRAGHSTVQRIMDAGARGCQVVISGKLTGERHRTEKFREGHVKYCGETKKQWMHDGFAIAKKKPGVIGIKVQIMDKNAWLPDEVRIITVEEKLKMDGKSLQIPGTPEVLGAQVGDAKVAAPGVPVPEGTAPAAVAKPTKEVDIADADVGEVLSLDEKDLKAKKPVLPSLRRPPRGRNKPAKIPDRPEGPEAVKPPEPKHTPVPPPKVEPKVEVKPAPQPKVEPKVEVKPAPVAPAQPVKPPVVPTPEAKPAEKKKSEDLDDLLSKLEKDLK